MSKTFHTILVPVDFSVHSVEALRYAAALAERFDASIITLHVVTREIVTVATHQRGGHRGLPPHAYGPYDEALASTEEESTIVIDLREQALEALEHFVPDELRPLSIARRVAVGHPFEQILETAAHEQADLIVMGTHGRTGLVQRVIGSVADRVVRLAACPVLTVKAAS